MKYFILLLTFLCSFTLFGQGTPPTWLDKDFRGMKYPADVYLTGFAERIVEKNISEETQKAKTEAQADLVKQVRAVLQTKTQSGISVQSINGHYDEQESFNQQSISESNAEIVGMKTETYFDQKAKTIYAFAYTNKYELIGYYKSNLSVNLNQIESFVKTAQDLEANGEKAKARQQLELAKPIFSKLRYAQDLLTAIDVNATVEDLQQQKTETLYNSFTQMQAHLAQAVYVYVESKEDLFGQKVDIVANKLKAELATKGCSFVENPAQADFNLKLNVSTRYSSSEDNLVFCYADTQVELYDTRKQKVVYSDEIAQKGGSVSQDKAARKAMSDVAPQIIGKLKSWIEN